MSTAKLFAVLAVTMGMSAGDVCSEQVTVQFVSESGEEAACDALFQASTQQVASAALDDPHFVDSDSDGLFDWEEEREGTDPFRDDTDGDGLRDYIELVCDLDPQQRHSYDRTIADGDLDMDDDGWSNLDEQKAGSDLSDPTSNPKTPTLGEPPGWRHMWRKVDLP